MTSWLLHQLYMFFMEHVELNMLCSSAYSPTVKSTFPKIFLWGFFILQTEISHKVNTKPERVANFIPVQQEKLFLFTFFVSQLSISCYITEMYKQIFVLLVYTALYLQTSRILKPNAYMRNYHIWVSAALLQFSWIHKESSKCLNIMTDTWLI